MKLLTIFLSFLIVLLVLSTGTTDALVQSIDCCSATATVCSTPVKLGPGTNGSSSFSTTSDSGTANISAGMRFNEGADAMVSTSTPTLDGYVSTSLTKRESGSVSFSAIAANELIYVIVSIEGTSSAWLPDGGSLIWNQRGNVTDGSNVRVETWYAISPIDQEDLDINIHFASYVTFTIIAFTIKGVNIAQPFDPNTHIPASNKGVGATQSVTMSTTNPNEFIIGALVVSCVSVLGIGPNPTTGRDFTNINSITNNDWWFLLENHYLVGAGEYKTTSSAQSSISISYSTTYGFFNDYRWAIIGDAIQGVGQSAPSPINDTSTSTPSSSDSYSIPAGSSAYLWSPVFTNTTTIYSGSWVLDLWASKTSGTMNVTFAAVNSSGAITSIAASGKTGTISTTTKMEFTTMLSGSNITVPSGGRLLAILTNPAGSGACMVYWGSGSMTNFQTPKDFDHVIAINNTASSSYSVSIIAYNTSSISRLTNLTISLYSPETTEVKVTNGVLTQSSGTSVKLNDESTLYVHVVATANAFGSSSITLLIKISTGSGPYFIQVLNLTVN